MSLNNFQFEFCPFCGSTNIAHGDRRGFPVAASCVNCGAQGPSKLTGREADNAWNDRTQPLPTLALSVRQPWAWLIVKGFKDVENRSWRTRFAGRIYIHASSTMTEEDYIGCESSISQTDIHLPKPNQLPRGGIVGSVDLVACVMEHHSFWFEGQFGFVLNNPREQELRPCRGLPGFFRPNIHPIAQ